jgi:hypothetical protein
MERVTVLSSHITASAGPSWASAALIDSPQTPLIVTIIGGGNSGHVCASLIHENTNGKVKVQLFTSKPNSAWSTTPVVKFPDGTTQKGLISVISSNPREVLPQSDIVIWTGPVNATKAVFEMIRPFIDPSRTVVGTIFAQGLTHILAYKIFGPRMKFFALRNIPWLCRTTLPGRECEIVGPKTSIEAAVVNLSEQFVKETIQPLFIVKSINEPVINLIPDFVPIVFNPANQLIHPAVYYCHFRKWRPGQALSGQDEPNEWLYRDMSELAGNILQELDDELQAIKDAYFNATGLKSSLSVLSLRDRLLIQYGDQIKDKSTMAKLVGTNSAYSMAKTPMIRTPSGVVPNATHRVVVDDIGWGLCVLVSIGERLGVPTYMMKMLISWHQDLMGKEYLVNGKISGKDVGELVLIAPNDPLEMVAMIPTDLTSANDGTAAADLFAAADAQADEERIGNP